jgi:hypothetical protein
MFSIQLDIASDCPHIELFRDTKKYNISIKLITECGPGGGNPTYEFFGQFASLTQFCNDYDFPEEYIEEVK